MGTPVFRLAGNMPDGIYRFELTAATDEMVPLAEGALANMPDRPAGLPRPFTLTGSFAVQGGAIVRPETPPEEQPDAE